MSWNESDDPRHKYSTYFLISLLFIFVFVAIVSALTSEDLDDICAENNMTLFRFNGTWMCGNFLDGVVINYTINNITNLYTNYSFYANSSDYWDNYNSYLDLPIANYWTNVSRTITTNNDVEIKKNLTVVGITNLTDPIYANGNPIYLDLGERNSLAYVVGGYLVLTSGRTTIGTSQQFQMQNDTGFLFYYDFATNPIISTNVQANLGIKNSPMGNLTLAGALCGSEADKFNVTLHEIDLMNQSIATVSNNVSNVYNIINRSIEDYTNDSVGGNGWDNSTGTIYALTQKVVMPYGTNISGGLNVTNGINITNGSSIGGGALQTGMIKLQKTVLASIELLPPKDISSLTQIIFPSTKPSGIQALVGNATGNLVSTSWKSFMAFDEGLDLNSTFVTSGMTLATGHFALYCNATTGNINITIPRTGTFGTGGIAVIKKIDATSNRCILDGSRYAESKMDNRGLINLTYENEVITIGARTQAWGILSYYNQSMGVPL